MFSTQDPDRLSFIRPLRIIRRQITNQAGFSLSPSHEGTKILERANPPRTSPRVVKRIHVHAYRKKQRAETTTRHPDPHHIKILTVS
ncbi:hypothetical protein [Streptomyces sp. NPDC057910]|uniref:hypothetical protein n=1 Tax=Streptomyces sp. NPDC057910 TaxID=3346278 RepID=UPI0036F04043